MKLTKEWSLKTLFADSKKSDLITRQLSSRHHETDYTFDYPGVVTGHIHSFVTAGMELCKLEIELANDLTLYADDHIERYVSSFVTRGRIDTDFGHAGSRTIQPGMSHIFTHIEARSCVHHIRAGKNEVIYLNLKPEFLMNVLPEWDALSDKITWENKGSSFHLSHARNLRNNIRLQQLLTDFSEEKFEGNTKGFLFEVKAMELLATQLDELDNNHVQSGYTISPADKDKLAALHDFISIHYAAPIGLAEMAQKFLLNEFKIKKGFKQLFGESAFSYMQRLRLTNVHAMLQSGAINVSDASDLAGYSSIHNFSNAFFKKFGYRPGSVVRNSNRKQRRAV